jgi:hypothetical protein
MVRPGKAKQGEARRCKARQSNKGKKVNGNIKTIGHEAGESDQERHFERAERHHVRPLRRLRMQPVKPLPGGSAGAIY